MKIALLYSLLIYQLLQHCDATATADCRPLSEVRAAPFEDLTATIQTPSGSHKKFYPLTSDCNDPGNNNHVLLHLNHHTGELDFVLQQQDSKFMISDIQLNTSGIFCAYKQCAPQDREQCCTRIIVIPPEVEIILPGIAHHGIQERSVCFAKTWPLLTTNDLHVFTNGSCAITKFPFNISDVYTATISFTLDHISGPCVITCSTQFKEKIVTISPTTTTPTSTSTEYHTPGPTTGHGSTPSVTPTHSCSGVLGLYRITLWIIVLTLTLLSTAITSLAPGFP